MYMFHKYNYYKSSVARSTAQYFTEFDRFQALSFSPYITNYKKCKALLWKQYVGCEYFCDKWSELPAVTFPACSVVKYNNLFEQSKQKDTLWYKRRFPLVIGFVSGVVKALLLGKGFVCWGKCFCVQHEFLFGCRCCRKNQHSID